jgi:hypothetical protein
MLRHVCLYQSPIPTILTFGGLLQFQPLFFHARTGFFSDVQTYARTHFAALIESAALCQATPRQVLVQGYLLHTNAYTGAGAAPAG